MSEPIRLNEAERFGLSPLLLYVLCVPDTNQQWMTFSPAWPPIPLMQVLQQAWTSAFGLRGPPDILRISHQLAHHSPSLPERLARHGVEIRISERGDKAHQASLRSAQQQSRWTLGGFTMGAVGLEASIQTLCRAAHREHELRLLLGAESTSRRALVARTMEWLALPLRPFDSETDVPRDWTLGPWLSDWEDSLPPALPRYLHTFSHDGHTHLLTGLLPAEETEDEGHDGEEDHYSDAGEAYSQMPELVKHLVASWPSTQLEISRHVGVTRRELERYTMGKAGIHRRVFYQLEALFNLEFDELTGNHDALGPFVLKATNRQSIKYLFDEVSQGGDAQPYEIVPRQGEPDPLWRYVLIKRGKLLVGIVMAGRGSQLVEQLPELVANYQGIRGVDPDMYRDVVLTCGRAAQSPEANVREMKAFQERYLERWQVWV